MFVDFVVSSEANFDISHNHWSKFSSAKFIFPKSVAAGAYI